MRAITFFFISTLIAAACGDSSARGRADDVITTTDGGNPNIMTTEDGQPPTVRITYPTSGSEVDINGNGSSRTVTVTATITDPSGVAVAMATLYGQGAPTGVPVYCLPIVSDSLTTIKVKYAPPWEWSFDVSVIEKTCDRPVGEDPDDDGIFIGKWMLCITADDKSGHRTTTHCPTAEEWYMKQLHLVTVVCPGPGCVTFTID